MIKYSRSKHSRGVEVRVWLLRTRDQQKWFRKKSLIELRVLSIIRRSTDFRILDIDQIKKTIQQQQKYKIMNNKRRGEEGKLTICRLWAWACRDRSSPWPPSLSFATLLLLLLSVELRISGWLIFWWLFRGLTANLFLFQINPSEFVFALCPIYVIIDVNFSRRTLQLVLLAACELVGRECAFCKPKNKNKKRHFFKDICMTYKSYLICKKLCGK